ncbi:hypothetical protein O181_043049 [Austropuccinia psidii MF-1]|uniref:Uncharacterized protein n=1 Tax=Austropuccinia psidii MF-1 TaxID=1389203 RepID=A0A9Q3HI20_9BASI|nr:hypothetical protein [Austropuccinia psidii MF-1]
MDFIVLENFNQMSFEEKHSISYSSKEYIPPAPDRKSEVKELEKDKLEVEDSEAKEKIKDDLKKVRRNWDMAIEYPEKWLALELRGMNKEDQREIPKEKF